MSIACAGVLSLTVEGYIKCDGSVYQVSGGLFSSPITISQADGLISSIALLFALAFVFNRIIRFFYR